MATDDLEDRIRAAAAFAHSEEVRYDAEATGNDDLAVRNACAIHSAAFYAVRVTLEELLEPGVRSNEDPPPI